MPIEQLSVRNFRCFKAAKLDLNPELNWITGQNASGKTSLLEALFFLGHGRSFRNTRPDRLIRTGADGFELVARLEKAGRHQVLGVGRNTAGPQARLAGEPLKTMAEAAKVLPVVVLDSEMNVLVSGGPGERRRWLDWGVFHVEQDFLSTWRGYQQALRQRNHALRAGSNERTISPWSAALAASGEALDQLRARHLSTLSPVVLEYAATALPDVELSLAYRKGWPEDENLLEALVRHLPRDRETGNTRSGPHRADIQLRVDGLPAEERLSRGQQKMVAGAMWLAQVQVFAQQSAERPLLLVDDLAAELDNAHLARFLALLGRQPAQQVLTAIADNDIVRTGLTQGAMFHVEHGAITQ